MFRIFERYERGKTMQNELQHLVKTYRQDGEIKVHYNEGCKYESSLLKKLFPYLRQYERPDIIATQDDELLIMEHFIFDGTKESRKGMKGRQEENQLTTELNDFYMSEPKCGMLEQKIEYVETAENYIINFQKHFNEHYAKIPDYIKHISEDEHKTFKQISVGFFIENEYPPFGYSKDLKGSLIRLPFTKQFLDVFENSPNLDFVLFGCCDQGYRLSYIDKSTIAAYRKYEIDLSQITFRKLNEVQFGFKDTCCDDT